MKYTKKQKEQIQGFEGIAQYKKLITEQYKLQNIKFKIIEGFIVISSKMNKI